MMGGGTFILLKVGHFGPKSAKQTEIRLAGLPKILKIAFSRRKSASRTEGRVGCVLAPISAGYG
jgi:hypothetical protein